MAGDWIKMRTNLHLHPKVILISSQLGIPELHTVGCLWMLWSWADQHSEDGNAICVTDVTLDRFTGVTGFAYALRNVGWLIGNDGCISFPNYTNHNGETAKKRAETKERVKKHRNAKSVTDVTQKVLPEKRREEKRRITTDTQSELISNYLTNEEFAGSYAKWKAISETNHNHRIGGQQEQMILSEIERNFPTVQEAIDALRFSAHIGSKHVRREDKRQAAAPKRSNAGMEINL